MEERTAKYLKQVKNNLSCPKATKQMILAGLKQQIHEYVCTNDSFTFEDLCNNYGNPKQLAEQLMENFDPKEVKATLKRKKAIIISCISAVIMAVSALVYLLYEANILMPEKAQVTITIYDGENPNVSQGGI